jgi:hypothetical protein
MRYRQPHGISDPDASYVDGNTGTGTLGSVIPAEAVENPQREIVAVVEAAGLTPSAGDTTQLAQAIAILATGATPEVVSSFAPFYPEVTSGSGALALTVSSGQIVVGTSGVFVWRAWKRIQCSGFDLADRTFTTAASHTYHLRWYAPGIGRATPPEDYPLGRFYLEDLADTADYNPSALAETDAAFDTSYDSMLVARVVTDGSNVLTATALINKHRLFSRTLASQTFTRVAGAASLYPVVFPMTAIALNWARTPAVTGAAARYSGTEPGGKSDSHSDGLSIALSGTLTDGTGSATAGLNRYSVSAVALWNTYWGGTYSGCGVQLSLVIDA